MYLTFSEYRDKIDRLGIQYWKEGCDYRWEYMSAVIDELRYHGPVNLLEMGTYYIPLSRSSYLLEIDEKFLVNEAGVVHDLNSIPYPFGDKYFDCAVALQVWEHLKDRKASFDELRRVSKMAILSFPWMWNHGDRNHRGIDTQKIYNWTGGVKPIKIMLIKNRVIYVWKF